MLYHYGQIRTWFICVAVPEVFLQPALKDPFPRSSILFSFFFEQSSARSNFPLFAKWLIFFFNLVQIDVDKSVASLMSGPSSMA